MVTEYLFMSCQSYSRNTPICLTITRWWAGRNNNFLIWIISTRAPPKTIFCWLLRSNVLFALWHLFIRFTLPLKQQFIFDVKLHDRKSPKLQRMKGLRYIFDVFNWRWPLARISVHITLNNVNSCHSHHGNKCHIRFCLNTLPSALVIRLADQNSVLQPYRIPNKGAQMVTKEATLIRHFDDPV